ncbi:MAG: DOMON-like domain-containing protein [Proteobacteria bacterium]|nr:DOMON-like domain-containing protein [Pseudomonadota bacterium]
MKKRCSFHLQPFNQNDPFLNIHIKGAVERQGTRFTVGYEITGDLSQIHFPSPWKAPERKSHLWEDTCLEFFIGPESSSKYWEFNCSPSGDWNVFRFEDYRNHGHGGVILQEEAFAVLPFMVHREFQAFSLVLEMDAGEIIKKEERVEMGVNAIIKRKTQNMSFWALHHGSTKPDFHERKDFLIKL